MTEEKEPVVTSEEDNVEVDLDAVKASDEVDKEPKEVEKEVETSTSNEEPVEEEKQEKPKATKFQKRIDDLTFERREAERQRDEYYRVAQQAVEENKTLREQAKKFSEIGTQEMEGHIKSEIEASRKPIAELMKRAMQIK